MTRITFATLAMICAGTAVQAQTLDVPVMIGGSKEMDACFGNGVVTGLDPKGDNFLSVRSGPGGKPYREVDRLHTNDEVIICDQRGPWMAVVYGRNDCWKITMSPLARRQPYPGPCRAGWIHKNYVRVTAG